MQGRKIRMLTETIQSFLNRGAAVNLQKLLNKSHVADIALAFRDLSLSERKAVFSVVHGAESRAELLEALDSLIQRELIGSISESEAARILECMPHDHVADLLGILEESLSSKLLDEMHREDSLQVEGLLGYARDTAGGIMSTEYVALTEDTPASDAIDVLRTSRDVDMVFYLYVVNEFGHLVGVVSLRNLVTVPSNTKLRTIMETRVIRVRPETDQEEVASLVACYNFLAIPVVDEGNNLIGIVTVDNVIDVIQEEAQEDMLRMAGAGGDLEATRKVKNRFAARFPWVALAIVCGIASLLILNSATSMFYEQMTLVLFLPFLFVVTSMIGVQSSTFVVQILSSGLLPRGGGRGLLYRESLVGLGLGMITGAIGGLVASTTTSWSLALAVGVSLFLSVAMAAFVGACLPLLMRVLKQDPAIATSPITRVCVHLTSLAIYLGTAELFLYVFDV